MPRWLIQHSPNTLTPEEKSHLAQQITQAYVGFGLPAFYVQVHFTEQPADTSFIGGEQHPNFVALTIYHLARTMTSDEQRQGFLKHIDAVMTPMFEPKGIDWEYFVTEAPRDLWKINGLVPPAAGSEEEKVWACEVIDDYGLRVVHNALFRRETSARCYLLFDMNDESHGLVTGHTYLFKDLQGIPRTNNAVAWWTFDWLEDQGVTDKWGVQSFEENSSVWKETNLHHSTNQLWMMLLTATGLKRLSKLGFSRLIIDQRTHQAYYKKKRTTQPGFKLRRLNIMQWVLTQ
ncbi:hypothetical protein GB937_009238 [Aspergillus fischeri]|nr:hypothetical protein GB937_009238 [Aspergillus fischeri]